MLPLLIGKCSSEERERKSREKEARERKPKYGRKEERDNNCVEKFWGLRGSYRFPLVDIGKGNWAQIEFNDEWN